MGPKSAIKFTMRSTGLHFANGPSISPGCIKGATLRYRCAAVPRQQRQALVILAQVRAARR